MEVVDWSYPSKVRGKYKGKPQTSNPKLHFRCIICSSETKVWWSEIQRKGERGERRKRVSCANGCSHQYEVRDGYSGTLILKDLFAKHEYCNCAACKSGEIIHKPILSDYRYGAA